MTWPRRSRRIPTTVAIVCIGLGSLVASLAGTVRGGRAEAAGADPILPQQWALARIHATEAWATTTGQGAVVAVVDSGVDFDHEDLRGQSAGSFTCVGSCMPGGGDIAGHGTAVASVIAAASNNGVGIASVAPGAKILSVRVLDAQGGGTVEDVSRGITFAADQGAKVVNVSIGTNLDLPILFGLLSPDLQHAVDYAWGKGAIIVAAAGNGGLASSYTGMRNLFVVGATGPDDEVASYSSSLTGVTLYAPGGDHTGDRCTALRCITAAETPNVYRAMEGTSFAAPHVSGVAALLSSIGLSNSAIASRLTSTGDPIGRGLRLNAARAVGPPQAAPAPAAPAAPLPSPTVKPPVVRGRQMPVPVPVAAQPASMPPPEPSPSPSPATSPPPSASSASVAAPAPPRAAAASTTSGSGPAKAIAVVGVLLAVVAGAGVLALVRRKG